MCFRCGDRIAPHLCWGKHYYSIVFYCGFTYIYILYRLIMEILVVIVGLVIGVFLILCLQWNREKETYGFGMLCGGFMVALCFIETICICEIIDEPCPNAMDVYRGKTTLKYEVVDGVKVDSVVVFKENHYERQNQKVY